MNDLTHSKIGYFEAEDALVVGDPKGNYLTVASKKGFWKVSKLENDCDIQELQLVHESISSSKESKLEWIPETFDLEISSGICGIIEANYFHNSKKELVFNCNAKNKGFLLPIEKGSYSLFLAFSPKEEVIAVRIVFKEIEDEDLFESYTEDTILEDKWYE
jgi:hypothetical protein